MTHLILAVILSVAVLHAALLLILYGEVVRLRRMVKHSHEMLLTLLKLASPARLEKLVGQLKEPTDALAQAVRENQ